MLLVIDNYDSFTFNLVQYLGELGCDLEVYRHDQITMGQVRAKQPQAIVISPGPGRPEDAGISMELIQQMGPTMPILGVCLGHQCIGQVYGGEIVNAPTLMHGKTSAIRHQQVGVFRELSNPFEATRYHSLIIDRASCPAELEITAWCDQEQEEPLIMGVRHRQFPHIQGVQFHPESVLTGQGMTLLKTFVQETRSFHGQSGSDSTKSLEEPPMSSKLAKGSIL